MKRYKVKIIHTIIKEFELTKKNKKEVKKERKKNKRNKKKIINKIIKKLKLKKKNKKEVKKEIDYMKNKTVILEPPYVELKERNKTIIKRKLGSKKYEKNS